MEIGAGEDFRLRALTTAETYNTPLDAAGEVVLAHHFHRLCPHPDAGRGDVTILGRSIPVRKVGKNVAWFDFSVLCGD
jgi:cell division protein ZapE